MRLSTQNKISRISRLQRSTSIKMQTEKNENAMKKSKLPERLRGNKSNVWTEYTDLEMKYDPINIGHGFPDMGPPSYITKALSAAALSEQPLSQQYTRGFGHTRLVNAIGDIFSSLIKRTINPCNEVLVTVGGTEAIFTAIMGHVEKGDEVILIEPFFDCYDPIVKMAGGTPRYVPLRPGNHSDALSSADFCLDDRELEALFNEKTKMIILNTPHNPTGKVFKRHEMETISNLCRKWDVICLSDEVYEWLVYDGNEHIRICTLPDMWERTITVGSAGKTFSVTGWKIGWAYGPENLIENLRLIHENCVYSCATPLQEAVAECFEHEMKILDTPECYFHSLVRDLKDKRDFLTNVLEECGMQPIKPEGGYFLVADWRPFGNKIDLSTEKDENADYRFTKWMLKYKGVEIIPTSAFYSDENKKIGENYIRFSFIKCRENLEKAAAILKGMK